MSNILGYFINNIIMDDKDNKVEVINNTDNTVNETIGTDNVEEINDTKLKAFDIICQIIPDYEQIAETITVFLERHKNGCLYASKCDQCTVEKTNGLEMRKSGIIFACEDSLIFLSEMYETSHELNNVENVTIDGKRLIIRGNHEVVAYEFKEKTDKILVHVNGFFEMKGSIVKVNKNYIKPKRIRVVMLTIGSRGDVQPFINLGLGMKDRGYDVKIVTHKCFEDIVRQHDIDFFGLSFDPKKLMSLCVNNTMFSYNFVRESFNTFLPYINDLLNEAWEGCKDANMLIATPTSLAGYHIAEKMDIPFYNAFTMPSSTSEQQNVLTMNSSDADQPSWYSSAYISLSNFVTDQSMWLSIRKKINRWRRDKLGLPVKGYLESNNTIFNKQKVITLYCFSQVLYEKPSDWSEYVHISGYWRNKIEKTTPVSDQLVKFIKQTTDAKRGIHPVLVSFGSIPVPNADSLYQIFIKVSSAMGLPIIICKNWSQSDVIKPSSSVYVCDEIPYDAILPYVKFMCHHGGAGTTASCLYNKKPMIIVPFFGDQFLWGKLVQEKGIGHVVPYKEISEQLIMEAFTNLCRYNTCYQAILKVTNALKMEDGVENAINIIESYKDKAFIPPSFVPDSDVDRCSNVQCQKQFGYMGKHHCRNCGMIFCNTCSKTRLPIYKYRYNDPERICINCVPIVSKDYL